MSYFIQFNGDIMFEYNLFSLHVYGFIKIQYIDEKKLMFKYKKKNLIIKGKNLKVLNLIDKSVEIKGLVEGIDIEYDGGNNE